MTEKGKKSSRKRNPVLKRRSGSHCHLASGLARWPRHPPSHGAGLKPELRHQCLLSQGRRRPPPPVLPASDRPVPQPTCSSAFCVKLQLLGATVSVTRSSGLSCLWRLKPPPSHVRLEASRQHLPWARLHGVLHNQVNLTRLTEAKRGPRLTSMFQTQSMAGG